MKLSQKFLLFVSLVALTMSFSVAVAKEITPEDLTTVFKITEQPGQNKNLDTDFKSPQFVEGSQNLPQCFDYYKFQSIGVLVSPNKISFSPGEVVSFSGQIENQNNYPVVDGYLFVRVSKENKNYITEGYNIVDEFFGAEKVSIDGKGKKNVNFQWQVPSTLTAGNYKVDYFFSVGKKFNLGGLPFTNEIIAGESKLEMVSKNVGAVSFDRSATVVNKIPYRHIGNWPVVKLNESAVIAQSLKNTYKEAKTVSVKYDLYYWDSLDEKDKIKSSNEEVVVSANSSKTLTYTIDKVELPVYMLKITATSGANKTVVNIRVLGESNRARLNYPALTNFPLKSGEQATLFSCFHNTSNGVASGKMFVSLFDKNNSEVGRVEYSGDISSIMMADKKEITATKDYTYLKMKAELYDAENKLVDSYENVYDCQTLDSAKCKEMTAPPLAGKSLTLAIWTTVGFLVILLAVIIFLMTKRGGGAQQNTTSISGLVIALIFSSFMLSSYLGWNKIEATPHYLPQASQGDQNVVGTQRSRVVTSKFNHYINGGAGGVRPIATGDVSARHLANIIQNKTNINKTEKLNFNYSADSIQFSATGGSWDTPYGAWRPAFNNLRSNTDPFTQSASDFTFVQTYGQGFTSLSNGHPGYLYFIGFPPGTNLGGGWVISSVTLTSSNPSILSCSGMECTGQSAGTVTVTMNIPGTITRLYSVFKAYDDDTRQYYWTWSAGNTMATCIDPGEYPFDAKNYYINPTTHASCVPGPGCVLASAEYVFDGNCGNGQDLLMLPATTMSWNITVTDPSSACSYQACENNSCVLKTQSSNCPASNCDACGGGGGSSCTGGPNVQGTCPSGLCCSAATNGTCSTNCSIIPPAVCGNSIKEGSEECDDGASGSATCTTSCTLKHTSCGPTGSTCVAVAGFSCCALTQTCMFSSECPECLGDPDCTDPSKPICEGGRCVGVTDSIVSASCPLEKQSDISVNLYADRGEQESSRTRITVTPTFDGNITFSAADVCDGAGNCAKAQFSPLATFPARKGDPVSTYFSIKANENMKPGRYTMVIKGLRKGIVCSKTSIGDGINVTLTVSWPTTREI